MKDFFISLPPQGWPIHLGQPFSFGQFIHDYINLVQFVIPGLTKPALHRMVFRACPVLDTGESGCFPGFPLSRE
jgi:hypothetical protein